MSKTVFVSYARREAPFVDALVKDLGDSFIQTWVDYRNLIPGKPWLEQIFAGIHAADIFLLVVSKASIVSKNVEIEYKHALEQKKRIILIIFEAIPLPATLLACEWVDFRGSYGKKYKKLLKQFDRQSPQPPAPQNGFKTSFTVWLTFVISLFTIAISIPGWWTIFIPILLIPLPLGILKRDFNFYRTRFAVFILPAVLFSSAVFFQAYQFFTEDLFMYFFLAGCLIAPILYFLLSSKGMRVWGKPGASAPRFANPYRREIKRPEPVAFFIEYAPEDTKYAGAISNELIKFGHTHVKDAEQAQVNFAIISGYKNTISTDPESHMVFPIIVQDTVIEDRSIQRVQWIDFRHGLRYSDNLAKFLSEPAKLLQTLGVIPISGQDVYPRIIQMLDYFLTLLAFFSISIWIPLAFEFGKDFIQSDANDFMPFVIINLILSAITLRILFSLRRALVSRKGNLASLRKLIGSLLWVGFIGFFQYVYILGIINIITAATNTMPDDDMRGLVAFFLPFSFTLGIILVSFFGLLNRDDLTRWFPQRQKKKK